MMKYKLSKLIVAIGFFLSVFVMPLKAADVGIAFGVYGNMSTFSTSGSETETSPNSDKEITTASIDQDVDFGSIFIELDSRDGWFGFALGLEHIPGSASLGAKSRADTTTDAKEDDQSDGTYTAKAEISDHISVYIEPTIYPHENFGLYLKGGVSRVTVNSLESIAIGTDSSVYGNESVLGTLFGVGVKATHSSGFFAKLEYAQTIYGTVELTSSTGNQNTISASPEQKSTRLAIGYKF